MSLAASQSLLTATTTFRLLRSTSTRSSITLLLPRHASTAATTKTSQNKTQLAHQDQENAVEGIRDVTLQMQKDPQWDPWAQPLPTLDVVLPYRTAPWTGSRYSSITARLRQMWTNRANGIKNTFNKFVMIGYNSFPGVDMEEIRGLQFLRTAPVQLLASTKSAHKPTSWLNGMRDELFNSYCEAQKAIANKDRTSIGYYSQSQYLNDCLRLMRKQSPSLRYFWNLHASGATTKEHKTTILSIRAIEGHYGSKGPADGNRLVLQILAKIETTESLETYDASGKPIHTPSTAPSTPTIVKSSMAGNSRLKRVPAAVHSQTEYLVFEKKMYVAGQQWSIRERVYPREGAVAAA